MEHLDAVVTAAVAVGSALMGAFGYSYKQGASHKEVLLKLDHLDEQLTEFKTDIKERINNLERRYDLDGIYGVTEHKRAIR